MEAGDSDALRKEQGQQSAVATVEANEAARASPPLRGEAAGGGGIVQVRTKVAGRRLESRPAEFTCSGPPDSHRPLHCRLTAPKSAAATV